MFNVNPLNEGANGAVQQKVWMTVYLHQSLPILTKELIGPLTKLVN